MKSTLFLASIVVLQASPFTFVAKPGQESRFSTSIAIQEGNGTVLLEGLETVRCVGISGAKSEFERVFDCQFASIDRQRVPANNRSQALAAFSNSGQLIGVKSQKPGEVAAILSQVIAAPLPSQALKPGMEWKDDSPLASLRLKCLEFAARREAYRLQVNGLQRNAQNPLRWSGQIWIEGTNGQPSFVNLTIENATLGGTESVTLKVERKPL